GSLIDAHDSDVGARPQRLFQPNYREIGIWIGAAGTRVDIHDAELQTTECAGQFYSAINRDLITRYGVNANLPAEKQLILSSKGKVEYSGVFQKKLALLWNKYLEWCDIERLQIDFGVGEVGVAGEIQK